MKHNEPIPPKCLQVLNYVAHIFETPIEAILSKSRQRDTVTARHTAIAFFRSLMKNRNNRFTEKEVGSWFGRDHTSVIHSCNNVKNWIDVYPEYRANYERLVKACSHIFLAEFTLSERIDRLPKEEREGIIAYITKLENKGGNNA